MFSSDPFESEMQHTTVNVSSQRDLSESDLSDFHLQPEVFTVQTLNKRKQLIFSIERRRNSQGLVWKISTFWRRTLEFVDLPLPPPLCVKFSWQWQRFAGPLILMEPSGLLKPGYGLKKSSLPPAGLKKREAARAALVTVKHPRSGSRGSQKEKRKKMLQSKGSFSSQMAFISPREKLKAHGCL